MKSGVSSYSPRKYRRNEKWSNLLKGQSFYIHLPESKKTQRLEKRLNIFGGVVDTFFHNGISFVITSEEKCLQNREYDTRNSPSVPPRRSTTCILPRYATRTCSLLNKTNLKYSSQYHEVIKAAEKWGIKVKSFVAVNQWLSVVEKRMKASRTLREPPRVRSLKGTFIKIDDFEGKYKPLVKEFDAWPKLHIDSRACPFDREVKGKANKKFKLSPKRNEEKNKGYCETCEVTYRDLKEHIHGPQHKTFARNETNFRSLDKIIKQGPSVDDLRQTARRKPRTTAKNEILRCR